MPKRCTPPSAGPRPMLMQAELIFAFCGGWALACLLIGSNPARSSGEPLAEPLARQWCR
jgi:hypothetical protein